MDYVEHLDNERTRRKEEASQTLQAIARSEQHEIAVEQLARELLQQLVANMRNEGFRDAVYTERRILMNAQVNPEEPSVEVVLAGLAFDHAAAFFDVRDARRKALVREAQS